MFNCFYELSYYFYELFIAFMTYCHLLDHCWKVVLDRYNGKPIYLVYINNNILVSANYIFVLAFWISATSVSAKY